MQMFANGKQRFYSIMEFYVMQLQKSRGKILIKVPLKLIVIVFNSHCFQLQLQTDNIPVTSFERPPSDVYSIVT